MRRRWCPDALRSFLGARGGATAVEFAFVATPFVFLVLWIAQISIFYITQTSLDAGVNGAADYLRSSFAKATPTYVDAAALKAKIVSSGGGLVKNNANLLVDLQPLWRLKSSAVAITDETTPDYGAAGDPLVLRAQAPAIVFAPGFGPLSNVRSSAIVRRKSK
ncbi:pilus assembly protein [Methylosinus sp. H3A]|uniref:TadE/TadG family type IV pilus assembly protein n=1 Tax=Methylosinus sp. H3A TaxID=2785786 RepID=UPI0018C342AD|nr:TadE/TadG family type IV pilus assembly protein [Methylosinus sp. H3A]MBG0808751.1 pilus assembly protein [Methylosinus sp. H3A]